jgi:hypothetical protein
VQIAERERAIRQLTGVVPIRVVRFDNLLSYVERRGML